MSLNYTIRKAEPRDLEAVNSLLQQVLSVHHRARPDLFREIGKKYTDEQLLAIFDNPETPVFVYDREGAVLGYVFCILQHQDIGSLNALTTLYVDDLCVHEKARGQHIGSILFEYVKAFAREQGCHNITLHVWEGNPGARAFYDSLGLKPQHTCMELLCDEPCGSSSTKKAQIVDEPAQTGNSSTKMAQIVDGPPQTGNSSTKMA